MVVDDPRHFLDLPQLVQADSVSFNNDGLATLPLDVVQVLHVVLGLAC